MNFLKFKPENLYICNCNSLGIANSSLNNIIYIFKLCKAPNINNMTTVENFTSKFLFILFLNSETCGEISNLNGKNLRTKSNFLTPAEN